MNLYEIVYDLKRNEGDEWKFGSLYQIPADSEFNALVIFGQSKPNTHQINIVSIARVRG